MIECSSCHTLNADSETVCQSCGLDLPRPSGTSTGAARCPAGHTLYPSWTHCLYCEPSQPAESSRPPLFSAEGATGRSRWMVLTAAAVLLLAMGASAALLIPGRSADDTALAAAAPPPSPDPALAATPLQVQEPTSSTDMEIPAAAGLDASSAGSPQSLEPAPVARAEPWRSEPALTVEPRTAPARKQETKPAGSAAPAPMPRPVPPVTRAETAEPEEEPESVASESGTGVDQFNELNDVIVSLENLGRQTLGAYETEGREDELASALSSFAEAATSTRKEFRKVTGTGIRGLRENFRGMLRRNKGGREADTRVLQVNAEDLIRQGQEIDRLMDASSPGPITLEYWQEARRHLRRLEGFF